MDSARLTTPLHRTAPPGPEHHDNLRKLRPSRPGAGSIPAPVAAALVAAGIGSATLGVAIAMVEASTTVKTWAAMGTAAGPLTGKALGATFAFFLAWVILRVALGADRTVSARACLRVTSALVALGVLLTFPPVYGLFHAG
jgi:hypothetical protein